MLLCKSAAIWLHNKEYPLEILGWTSLKQDIQSYFQPADYHHCTCNALAVCTQNAFVIKYTNALKWNGQWVADIANDKMLDWFVYGLKPMVQCKILKDNPSKFSDTYIITEIIGWLDNYFGEMHPFVYAYQWPNRKFYAIK